MSSKEKIQPSEILRSAVKITAAGLALGVPGVAGVTALHHRALTHGSLEINPFLEAAINAEMKLYSPEPRIWAAVHRVHHSVPDAALDPFLDIAQVIKWKQANPDKAQEVTIPDSFPYLDPFVDAFSLSDVVEIGYHAENIMRDRLGGSYEPPSSYTKEELQAILNPTEPMYFYRRGPKHVGDYTQREIAECLLGDPHSPVRIPPPEQNGVRGVLEYNVQLYSRVSHLFRDRPDLMPKDLQNIDGSISRNRSFEDVARGVMLPAVLTLIAKGKYKPEDFAKAAFTGGAIYAIKLGLHIFGGNITNSLGHAGVMTSERFINAIFGKEYKPVLNPDGTVSTDSVNSGVLGRLISIFTGDEVGGQKEHHLGPGKIAYTSQEGIRAWMEAPWGRFLSFLARSRYFPLINEGPGFDLKEGEIRPDEPNPGVLIIHRNRVRQMQAVHGNS